MHDLTLDVITPAACHARQLHDRLTAASSPTADTARQRILAVFDAFTAEALSESCRGCLFLMVLAEFPDPQHPAHERAVAHKSWVRELFQKLVSELVQQSPLKDPDGVADQLALIADGIYGSAQAFGAAGPAQHGRACAEILLDAVTKQRLSALTLSPGVLIR